MGQDARRDGEVRAGAERADDPGDEGEPDERTRQALDEQEDDRNRSGRATGKRGITLR